MKITKCPHTQRKHYAKNMCSSCYRKLGRNQLAWNCDHKEKLNYSGGMCQTCYLSHYHQRTKELRKSKAKALLKPESKEESFDSISERSIARINQDIQGEVQM